ncbi:MAG: PQQ-binding-like beta-propeller repeat protein [Candidatus Acidiferrales bacterium]
MPKRNFFLLPFSFCLAVLLAAPIARADDWPTWRGPNRDGISHEKNLPANWSATDNVDWKLPLPGRSGATPIIWGERIFLTTSDGDAIQLWAVDRNKGAVLWKQTLGGGGKEIYRKQNMSSPSPVTDGKSVWVMTGTGLLKSFDFNGKEQWSRDIQKDYGAFGLNWGYASSPLLYDGSLFVQVLHGMKTDDPSYLLRIDAKTGKTLWRVERPTQAIRESPDSYTTPALLMNGKNAEIVITGGDCITGHDPATGKELWRGNGLNPQNQPFYRIVASPVVRDGLIYASTRVKPLTVFRAGGRGDITESHKAWSTDNGPDVPTPVTDGKYFFIVRDNGTVYCLDAKTGAEIWGGVRIRPGIYSSSPVLADGKIYATNEDGVTTVFKAGPEFEVLSENELGDYTLSSPAISDGQIFLRTDGHLFAIGQRK